MHWYEKKHHGLRPFKITEYQIAPSPSRASTTPTTITRAKPYLDGFVAIFAPKQSVRTDAIRGRSCGSGVPVDAAVGAAISW